jgi:hypothetical protein
MGHTALVTVTIEDEWRVEPLYGTTVTSAQLEQLGMLFDRMIARPDWRHDERWWVGLPTPPAIRALWNGIALYWEVRDEPDNYRIGFRVPGEPEWRWMDDEGFEEVCTGDRKRRGLRAWLDRTYPEGPPRRCYPRGWPVWALPPE